MQNNKMKQTFRINIFLYFLQEQGFNGQQLISKNIIIVNISMKFRGKTYCM